MKKFNKKILIATGGTGGHIFPAYSLAEHMIKQGIQIKITTDKRGLIFIKNYKNLDIKVINTDTIFKKNPIIFIISLFKISFAFLKALYLLLIYKPNIVFGMGGYSSFPICIAAKLLNIPFIIYENNLIIGKANKYLLPYAYKFFTAYPMSEKISEKYHKKTLRIGNIIRQNIINFKNKKIIYEQNQINILILGGSQAAKVFAEKLPKIFEECIKKKELKIKIFQQCTPEQNEELRKAYTLLNIEHEIFNFSENILDFFVKTDLAITRSGASMLAELLNCNIPFISIPLPSSADNHQLKNAEYFEKLGCGFLIKEENMSKDLFQLIKLIHKDKDLLNQVKSTQIKYSDKEVFRKIDNQIKDKIDE